MHPFLGEGVVYTLSTPQGCELDIALGTYARMPWVDDYAPSTKVDCAQIARYAAGQDARVRVTVILYMGGVVTPPPSPSSSSSARRHPLVVRV
jgi:hypothetical protein